MAPTTSPELSTPETTAPIAANDDGVTPDTPTQIVPHDATAGLRAAQAAAQVAIDNRAQDVAILDLSNITPISDYFVVATGTSRRQLHAIAEEIDDKLQRDLGDRRLGREGYDESRWILLDYGNVVIHLFDEETRQFYDIEGLWGDAVKVNLENADCEVRNAE